MSIAAYSRLLTNALFTLDYGNEPPALYDPVRYMMALGGKRVRPLLTLLGAGVFVDEVTAFIKPALAVEVFHNFTLLHDDLMDAAPLRRGQATVHHRWNANTAILSGDVMLVRAYELLADNMPDSLLRPLLKRFSAVAAEVCEGQQLDMVFEARTDVRVDEYLRMIELKTAVLLGFALELGARLAGAAADAADHLRAFGTAVGIAFQLRDDLLDVYGDAATFGKQVGGDILAAKKTFLLLTVQQQLPQLERRILSGLLANTELPAAAKVQQVTAIFDSVGIRAQTEALIQRTYAAALAHLAAVPVATARKTALRQLTDELLNRAS
ncbi:MAG: polyprenyl synthetase family protein [Hymenobacteraceae bacterium]|nr:polyprenyl synthetase family protein [Hymenobacteraceae bacterium]